MEEWFKVDNLIKQEQKRKKEYDKGNIDYGCDFDSYRGLVNGDKFEDTLISLHNFSGEAALTSAKALSHICNKYKVTPSKIADLGGGECLKTSLMI